MLEATLNNSTAVKEDKRVYDLSISSTYQQCHRYYLLNEWMMDRYTHCVCTPIKSVYMLLHVTCIQHICCIYCHVYANISLK
jgi:hypothetical protein